jgi:hypothetical protein
MLPFMEAIPEFEASRVVDTSRNWDAYHASWGGTGSAYDNPMKLLQCPSDPSMPPTGLQDSRGASSYAYNAQVFCQVGDNGSLANAPSLDTNGLWTVTGTQGWVPGASPTNYPTLPDSFGDGGAQTILFAERYSRCGPSSRFSNWWAYDANTWDWHPYIAVRVGYTGAYINGTLGAVPLLVKFQVQPAPFGTTACNPHQMSTGHSTGMNVCLGDASTRFLQRTITVNTLWAGLTPNGKDLTGSDW